MAEAVNQRAPPPPSASPRGHSPYRGRFRIALAVLLVIAVAAGVATVLLISAGRPEPPPPWSSWHPTSDGPAGLQEIANHVGRTYRLPNGSQLAVVRGGPLQVAGSPAAIALRSEGVGGIALLPGNGVLYTLCGLGPRCAIKEDRASPARHLYLRRQALELALYTFRYVKDVDHVAVLPPPPKGKPPSALLLFRQRDLARELDRPLRATLAGRPSLPLRRPEATKVERLTSARVFSFDIAQAPDATPLFVVEQR